jgi:hypothetical protein
VTDTLQDRRGATAPDALISLVYVSSATVPFSDADLALLLAVSRRNNSADGLTGVLLYNDGRFMQALEGPRDAVLRSLDRISADRRHGAVRIVLEEPIDRRRFGSWAMAHRRFTDEEVADAPAWFGSPEALQARDDFRAGELLAWFQAV